MDRNIENMLFIRKNLGYAMRIWIQIPSCQMNSLLIEYKVLNIPDLIRKITKKYPEVGLFTFNILEDDTN